METIGVGLIGTGYMGKCHALAWTSVRAVFGDGPKVRLAHLAEANRDLAQRKGNELGFERADEEWLALVRNPDVDVVSITTPNHLHAEMAIAALEAGKHVWCEKPMATRLEDSRRMRAAARASKAVAVLGYNYIQSPMFRQIDELVRSGAVGTVNHVRVEMDEDFMADPDAPFGLKSDSASGHGALDDFGVHPLSLLMTLFGPIARTVCHQAMPYPSRPVSDNQRRPVETYDIASAMFEFDSGLSGVMTLNRSAWGRKGRIALQIFGDKGSLLFDQERFNEVQLYTADQEPATRGFRTILAGPVHPPYDKFIPAPGHGLGFNDLKIIECRELISKIEGRESARVIDFETGFRIEQTVQAMARSSETRAWIDVPGAEE
jgi:predicted dehydrogenase